MTNLNTLGKMLQLSRLKEIKKAKKIFNCVLIFY
ncbi:uncharacterized protein METZ01_LOCUS117109 [marine metagenome]|uniref:Uncharacterized protein n=1 Tax=marine metagenome TaxID=408172 RepID=A0A381XHP5_9ZZZZ